MEYLSKTYAAMLPTLANNQVQHMAILLLVALVIVCLWVLAIVKEDKKY